MLHAHTPATPPLLSPAAPLPTGGSPMCWTRNAVSVLAGLLHFVLCGTLQEPKLDPKPAWDCLELSAPLSARRDAKTGK